MVESELYQDFIERAARELALKRDNTRILLSGLEFFPLNPDFFEKVRQGREQFELPCERIYDDLFASYTRQRQALDCHVLRRMTRFLRWGFCWTRVGIYSLFIWVGGAKKMFPPQPPVPPAPGKAASARPLTSIVMLSYNRLPYLRNTLSALLEMSAGAPYELIAVDNGSSDGSAEFLQAAHENGQVAKLLLLGENQGISAGYNRGFALADKNTGYLMKLDSDIKLLTQGWLGKAVDFLEANRQVGFVALNQVNDGFLTLLPLVRIGGVDVMDYGEWQLGSAMLFSKRLLDEIGFFTEDAEMTFVPDDIDYYVRASRKGYRAFYLRDVQVYHQWELDFRDYRAYTRGKPRDASIRLALRLARDYDRGTRSLEVCFEKYVPAGER